MVCRLQEGSGSASLLHHCVPSARAERPGAGSGYVHLTLRHLHTAVSHNIQRQLGSPEAGVMEQLKAISQ